MATTIVSSLAPEALSAAASSEALNQREAVLLHTLLANQGRVVTRTELARAVGLRQQARRVDVHLVNVRRALDDRLINVRGRGWMVPQGYELSPACQAELDAHMTAPRFAATEFSNAAPVMSA
jgi:DNA-binding winged helix-turn-helix (wHTH) protein